MVKEITSLDEFKKELAAAGDKLVIVDFTAAWCGPCQRIKPFFEKLCSENSDVAFLKVDVDKNEELTEEYEVTSMPTFLFIKCGKKIHSFSGADEKKLEAKLKELKELK